jgi:hypothetical protein
MTESIFGTDADESVEGIKATAFNLEGTKVVKTSLKKSSIVTTKTDDQNYEVAFTVPNVKEGTVIEYEYTIHSQVFWELRDWYAQCEIPVAYAKLDLNIPNYLIFNIEDHGIQRLTYTSEVGVMNYKIESDPLAKPMRVNTNHFVFVGRNLMGMPADDYVWNVQDYCAGITAELKEYRLPGMMPMDYAKTWEQIDAMVLDSEDLGKPMNDHSPLAAELKAAGIAEMAYPRDRVAAVRQLVMSKVKWNGKYGLSPEPTAETLKKGEGSNADINLLLIQSLREVGLTAAPVMLRTRDLGLLPYNFPSVRKLSTFIVCVIMPTGGNLYLDASSTDDLLPEVLLVERARLVQSGKKSTWVNLQKLSKMEMNTVIDAQLSADGTLSGKQTTRCSSKVVSESSFTKQGQVSDGQISICPFPDKGERPDSLDSQPAKGVHHFDGRYPIENPFTAETRKMPVEFPRITNSRVVVNITLPEGYVLDGEAKNTTLVTPDGGIEGRIHTMPGLGRVQMLCQLNINKLSFYENNYADVRQIFDLLSKYTSEKLVVRKK